jgi:hypothetical protein
LAKKQKQKARETEPKLYEGAQIRAKGCRSGDIADVA